SSSLCFRARVARSRSASAEAAFERLDLPAHRRLRQRDLVGGAREAEVPRRGLEGDEQLERRQIEGTTTHECEVSHAWYACDPFLNIVCGTGRGVTDSSHDLRAIRNLEVVPHAWDSCYTSRR